MKEIIDYILIQSDRPNTTTYTKSTGEVVTNKGISEMIQEKIKEGYQPYGFLNLSGEAQYLEFYQVMVKYD